MNKFKISHLKAMKKADIYSLCLTEFGNDTASTYKHYTKMEMIDDLMSVTMSDSDNVQKADTPTTATPDEVAAEPEPTTHQLEMPFTGFYESYHTNKPSEIIEQDIANADENDITLDDKTIDRIWDNFWGYERLNHDGFNWRKYYEQVANRYAYFVLCTVIDGTYQDLAPILQSVVLDSPREYNFTTDKIYAVMTQRPQNLTLEYFQANDLIDPLVWFIKERHSSRSGYISFVNPKPTLDEVFATADNNPYIDCAMYVLTCHAFGLDPYDGYMFNADEIDSQFIDYMYEQGYYDDFTYDNTPSVCFNLMQGKQI